MTNTYMQPLLLIFRRWLCLAVMAFAFFVPATAQDTVTGAFEGTVTDSQTGEAIADAQVEIINQATGLTITKRASARGRFFHGLLAPGLYKIRVAAPNYATREVEQRLLVSRTGEVVPVPVALDPATTVATANPTPVPVPLTAQDTQVRAETNAVDAQRGGSFTELEVGTLPLGGTTLTRSFDELALLLPGVVRPPQTLGNGSGPGQGAGVGSSGQFSVNGLRSRANNFTVDGSDNNDEDIGVRRQGFLALVPQPIESIREYQVTTLLAPAQFGRNLGGQINAVSQSGGNQLHGTIYGFLNSSRFNARNYFDSANGTDTFAVRSGNQPVIVASAYNFNAATSNFVPVNGRALTVRNQSGGKDSLTLGQGGFVLGGPVKRDHAFFFISYEKQVLNATQEANFAVPTVAQRGGYNSGATGLFRIPNGRDPRTGLPAPRTVFAFPTTTQGDAVFSLYPYANNPNGIYGANTLTQVLPASARGTIVSGKYDQNFKYRERQQSFTARYNFTNDRRILPVTGGALFSSLQPRVRTNNLSLFLNSEISAPNASVQIFNQLRASFGRTRLVFDEVRDPTGFLLPSNRFPGTQFLLNAPLLENLTLPALAATGDNILPNTGPVFLRQQPGATTEGTGINGLGPVGQIVLPGFSSIGVDVSNFPQNRANNTYQLADNLTVRAERHTFVFGYDGRRTELNSDLQRNFRPRITFNGAPETRPTTGCADNDPTTVCGPELTGGFITPLTLAAASAPSGVEQTLAIGNDAALNLRYYQLDFFAQDNWRILPNLSLSFGLRYEYNTPVAETKRRLEDSFNDPALPLAPGLSNIINGRRRVFDSDKNNFAPRLSLAYAPDAKRSLIIRAGYGVFYDQILGAVVSQSRSSFPRFLNVNTAGGTGNVLFAQGIPLSILNPALNPTFVQAGQLNRLPSGGLAGAINQLNLIASAGNFLPPASGIEITLPGRNLATPYAHQLTAGLEKQVNNNFAISAAYVGTVGLDLLRFSTPNLGSNAILLPFQFVASISGPQRFQPGLIGFAAPPGSRLTNGVVTGGRPLPGLGGVSIFETIGRSYYRSLQLQARGRLARALQFQTSYTLGRVVDDVSDVFDLAGASVLPQNSLTRAGERAPANFDARHRFAYNFVYEMPAKQGNAFVRGVLQDLQIAGTGQFQTGTPFTVNSLFDVNLDGNLTDRLNTTNGLTVTGDRRQPLRLTADPATLLAPIGQDGSIARNSFRAGNLLDLNLAFTKGVRFSERQRLQMRVEIFNFINRANYGIPVRLLEAPAFGQATDTVTPGRHVQFALKYLF